MIPELHVAVIVVAFRNTDDVVSCLQALARSTHRSFSIWICENGGDDASARLNSLVGDTLSSGQPVRIINPGANLGYAGGINLCLDLLETAKRPYDAAWILNPDTEPAPGALAALLQRLAKGDVDAVGSKVISENGHIQSYGGRWRAWLALGGAIGLSARAEDPVDAQAIEAQQAYLSGASMLVNRRFINVTGQMQADFFLYAEEVEWCLRARRRGLHLGFAPDALVLHRQGTTTGWAGPFRKRPKLSIYLDARNRIRLTRQLTPWFLPTAVAGILLHSLWRYARRGAWRQVGYVFEGVWAGLRNEAGRPSWAGN